MERDVLTHGIQIVEDLVHSDDFIIEFVVTVRIWKKCVAIRNEQIEDVYDLNKHIIRHWST